MPKVGYGKSGFGAETEIWREVEFGQNPPSVYPAQNFMEISFLLVPRPRTDQNMVCLVKMVYDRKNGGGVGGPL